MSTAAFLAASTAVAAAFWDPEPAAFAPPSSPCMQQLRLCLVTLMAVQPRLIGALVNVVALVL